MIKGIFIFFMLFLEIANAFRAVYWGDATYCPAPFLCPSGYTETVGAETAKGQCKKPSIEYVNIPSTYGAGYSISNSGVQGADAYIYSPNSSSCSSKTMSISPYAPTPHYGNNGLCYSDVGLYCKNTGGVSYDGVATCWKYNQSCSSGYNLVYNYSSTNDKCSKFNYSCAKGTLYGLDTHPTNNNTLDLFNRISDKDTKGNNNAVFFLSGNKVIVNDNQGSMCVSRETSSFIQGDISPSFIINAVEKSGF